MLTDYGKFIKKLRIDNDMTCISFAQKLGVSRQYISSVEHGRHNVPVRWVRKIIKHFGLDFQKQIELVETIAETETKRYFAKNLNKYTYC